MPQNTLHYRRPTRERSSQPWYRTDVAAAAVTVGAILAANGWLVWQADKSWGFWLWAFILIPLANVVLAGILVACWPIVRLISGMSGLAHVWVTVIGCATATFADAALIMARLRGC